jgi:hypothetical protein
MSYHNLKNAYSSPVKENFFMSYALRGEVLVPGTRQGVPTPGPIAGPISEPSPLNSEWRKEIPFSIEGIF